MKPAFLVVSLVAILTVDQFSHAEVSIRLENN